MFAGWRMNDYPPLEYFAKPYQLANALFRHGQHDLAKHLVAESYALVAHAATDEERGLLELLLKVWPQVADWKR